MPVPRTQLYLVSPLFKSSTVFDSLPSAVQHEESLPLLKPHTATHLSTNCNCSNLSLPSMNVLLKFCFNSYLIFVGLDINLFISACCNLFLVYFQVIYLFLFNLILFHLIFGLFIIFIFLFDFCILLRPLFTDSDHHNG